MRRSDRVADIPLRAAYMKQKEDLSKILCILTRAFYWT